MSAAGFRFAFSLKNGEGPVLDFSSNAAAFRSALSDAAQRQLPFAIAMAINDTVVDVKHNTEKRMDREMDRPTPFTKRGLFQRRASRFRLEGVVGFKPIQKGYLLKLETGGVRRPKGRAILVPVNQRLNKYGNMTRRAVAIARGKKNTFSGTPGRKTGNARNAGIYQRMKGGKLRLLVAYEGEVKYKKKTNFERNAKITAERRLPNHLRTRMLQAWNTRR